MTANPTDRANHLAMELVAMLRDPKVQRAFSGLFYLTASTLVTGEPVKPNPPRAVRPRLHRPSYSYQTMTASTTRARLLVVEFQTGALFTQDDNPFATGLAEVLVYLAKTYATPEKDNRISADLLRQLATELRSGGTLTQPRWVA